MVKLHLRDWRLLLIAFMVLGLFSALVVRMLFLQVGEGSLTFLQNQGEARVLRNEDVPAHRGMITDRYGKPLAVSTPVVSVWFNPRHVDLKHENIPALAKLLGVTEAKLKKRLRGYKNRGFLYLQRYATPEFAKQVLSFGIPGIYGQQEYRRFFPAGEVTSHLVGYNSHKLAFQEGAEHIYQAWLQGESGSKQVVKDSLRRTVKDVRQIKEPKPGKDLALSVDLRLQYIAYRALKSAVTKHQASAGSVVLLDVKTGEVLAMANQPAFNPNDRSVIDIDSVRNRAVTDLYEPGSTVKPFTVLAALESGEFTPTTKINTSPGYLKVGRKTLLDPVNYGVINVTKVLAKSSQVGTSKIALALEPERLHEMYLRLGLGEFIGMGYPGESAGFLPTYNGWKDIEQAAFGFGAGLSVTALQLAKAYLVIASGGIKKPVTLMRQDTIAEGERVVDEHLVGDLQKMLQAVTAPGGTAKKANTQYYTVAGKTGTSHKVGRGGYQAGSYVSLFAGFAPATDPRLVAVVIVDDPKGKEYYGGEVAAPVFSTLMADSLRLLNVAPDKIDVKEAQKWLVKH